MAILLYILWLFGDHVLQLVSGDIIPAFPSAFVATCEVLGNDCG